MWTKVMMIRMEEARGKKQSVFDKSQGGHVAYSITYSKGRHGREAFFNHPSILSSIQSKAIRCKLYRIWALTFGFGFYSDKAPPPFLRLYLLACS
jgi:hypothetical protein